MVSSLVDQVFKNKQSQLMVKEPNQDLMVKERYREPYPDNEYSDLIRGASEEHEVPYGLLYKLLETESQFNPQAKSPSGAYGIAQFMPDTWKSLGVDPSDPASAIPGAAKYLKQHYDRFGSWKNALAAYNAGQGNVKKYGGVPPFEETQKYIEKIYNEKWDQPKKPSGLQKNLVDQIFKAKGSEVEGGMGEVGATTEAPIEEADKPFNPREMTNSWFKNMYGVSADQLEDRPESDRMERYKESLSRVYSDFQVLKGKPSYVLKGIADLALTLPGVGIGMLDAGVAGIREVVKQKVLGDTHRYHEVGGERLKAITPGEMNLEEAYDAASEAMMKNMEFFEKGNRFLLGDIPEESRLIGEVFMAPLTAVSMVAHEVAKWPRFEDSPNVRGAAKFAGDILGMMAMGAILHGPSRKAEVGRKVEGVVNEGKKIIEKEKQVDSIPNEVLKQAQQKILEVEKRQLELKAKEIADSISKDAVIREDMMWQAEMVAKEKLRPVVGRADEVFVSKKGNRYEKIDGKWHDSNGQMVTNQWVIKAAEKGKKGPEVEEVKSKVKKEPKPAEPITKDNIVYRTTSTTGLGTDHPGGIHFSAKEGSALYYAELYGKPGEISRWKLSNDIKLWDELKQGSFNAAFEGGAKTTVNKAKQAGYDGVKKVNDEIVVWNKDKVKQEKPAEPIVGIKPDVTSGTPDVVTKDGLVLDKYGRRLETPEMRDKRYAREQELIDRYLGSTITKDLIDPFDGTIMYEKGTKVNEKVLESIRDLSDDYLSEYIKDNRGFKEVPKKVEPEVKKVEEPEEVTLFHGNRNKLEKPSDLSEGHRGYFFTESKDVASRYGDVYKVTISKDKIFDARNPEHAKDLDYIAEKTKHLNKLKGKQGRIDRAKEGSYPFYEDPQVQRLLEELGYKGNWQLSEGANVIRLLSRKSIKKIERVEEPKVVTELDRLTGTEVKGIEGKLSPFLQDKTKTQEMAKVFNERGKTVTEDLEMFTQKVINDVNQWRHGLGEINIEQAREGLSQLASRADELRGEFITEKDHLVWKDTVSEAAVWARRVKQEEGVGTDRLNLKRSEEVVVDKPKKVLTDAERIQMIKEVWERKQREKESEVGTTKPKWDKESASWKFEVDGKKQEIYRDPEDGMWYDAQRKHPMSQTRPLYIGDTKAQAIESIKIAVKEEGGKGGGTITYDIGGATVQGVKEIIKGAKSVAKYMEEARSMKKFKPDEALRMIREEGIRGFVDKSGNIRREMLDQLSDEGYKIVQKMVLSKGSSSLSASMLRQMQKEVYGGLSGKEKRVLDTLLLARRIGDIAQYKAPGKFKYPKGLEPTNVAAYSELFGQIEKLSLERASEINRRAEAYFEWMKKPLKDMLESGLISEQEFKDLSSHNYRKLKLVEIFDRKRRSLGKKGRTVYDSGVESLSRGRDTDIFEPSSEIMALEVFNRSYGRILNNEANKTLLDLARKNPENNFVRIKKDKKGDGEGVEKIPSGWHRSFVYEGGERKSLWISPEMAKEWIISNPEISYKASLILRWSFLSPLLRTFATGIDWAFALANLPRDIMHIWYTARTFKDGKWEGVYSSHAPVYGLQMGTDLARTFSDAALRRGRYEDYIKEGGGMEFLVHQGRLLQRGRHIGSKYDKVMDFLGYFGETSEIMTRLSIRDRVIRNRAKERGISFEEALKDKAIREEATFAARDYMDFGQGGTIAKAADNAFPYLNAAIQGTRGMFRSFKPGEGTALESTYKLAQFAALTTGTYVAFTHQAPNTMRALKGDLATQNNFVVPFGDSFGFEDEKGQMRYPYIKIPIDPSQKFFKTFFEASADKMVGNEVDVGRVVSTLKDQSPVGISTLPPSVSSVLGYAMNKDFWRNEDIWKRSEPFSYPNSQEEFIPGRTPQMFVDIGKATGLSPERTKYAVEELVTSGSIWTQLLMGGYEKAFSDLPKKNKEQHLAMTLARMPIVRRFIGVTNPYSKFADKIDEAEETAVLRRFMENRGLDVLAEGQLFYDNVKASEVAKYMASFKDVDTYDRLEERYDFHLATKNLPNRSFWLRLQGTGTDVRAKVFVDRLKSSGPEQRQELFKELGIVSGAKGLISDEFMDEVFRLMGKRESE